ncbi:hypothetical protein EXIGLDRAFT_411358 [Exidia glandulosa HHB12029]|uniref:JmjC domain-containing protein n=1 Tax=Exidia glandulosa HHB12029 TaxID=1314781 RepID=A0A165KPC0_EXIGL|nr:hypothetical protein EXIGLDRAFT_411358 [Exidia glandulosa HHB12029]
MSRFSTPAKRPRDLDTSSSYGLTSPALSASSSLPTTNTSPQRSPTTSTALGSPARLRTPSPTKGFAPPPRLPVFAREWTRMLTPSHPTYVVGQQVLEDLLGLPWLEIPVSLNCFPAPTDPSRQRIDLVRNVQCDLDALVELAPGAILIDSRPPGSSSLSEGASARAALAQSCPVAFDVQPHGERGLKAAPDPQLGPSFFSYAVARTIVAGSGTLCPPYASRMRTFPIVHAVLGQVVVLHFPITNENIRGPERGASLREQFCWAMNQPQAALRVLQPGDSLFIPPLQWRAMITLGYNGSSYAAVTLHYAREVDGDGERERSAKRHCG